VVHAPNSARIHFLYGNHLAQEVKQNKVTGQEAASYNNIAVDQFKQAIDIHPDHYESYFGLADILMQQNMPDQAGLYYRTIGRRLPNVAIVQYNLGNFYYKIHENDSSIVALKKAVVLDPKMAGAYNSLGSAYFGKGDYKNALVNYQKAAEIQPDFADAWKNIGSTYGSQQEYDKAIEAFQKALSLAPNDADIRRFLDMTLEYKKEEGKEMAKGK